MCVPEILCAVVPGRSGPREHPVCCPGTAEPWVAAAQCPWAARWGMAPTGPSSAASFSLVRSGLFQNLLKCGRSSCENKA